MEDQLLLGATVPLPSRSGATVFAFGVVDGHGGARAAKMVANQLPTTLGRHCSGADDGGVLPSDGCCEAFATLDGRILERAAAESWDDGACACVVLLCGSETPTPPPPLQPPRRRLATLLQLGDCNALLLESGPSLPTAAGSGSGSDSGCSSGPGPCATVPLLGRNHRPTEPSEAERLRGLGIHVSAAGRLRGLAVSRAFGDALLKDALPGGLLATPEVYTFEISSDEEQASLLLIACDGLWDFLPTDTARAIVFDAVEAAQKQAYGATPPARWSGGSLEAAARALVESALERGGTDNVSVLLVDIGATPSTPPRADT